MASTDVETALTITALPRVDPGGKFWFLGLPLDADIVIAEQAMVDASKERKIMSWLKRYR